MKIVQGFTQVFPHTALSPSFLRNKANHIHTHLAFSVAFNDKLCIGTCFRRNQCGFRIFPMTCYIRDVSFCQHVVTSNYLGFHLSLIRVRSAQSNREVIFLSFLHIHAPVAIIRKRKITLHINIQKLSVSGVERNCWIFRIRKVCLSHFGFALQRAELPKT